MLVITICCFYWLLLLLHKKLDKTYHFDDIIKIEDFNFDILMDKKSCKNILVYGISYKTLIGGKPLCVRLDELNGFIRVYDGTRYLVLFGPEKCAIYESQKSGVTYVFSHNNARIKIELYDSSLLVKTLILQ